MNDDCDIATNLLENILANVKIMRDHYSSCLESTDFEMLLEDQDFQWFLDELEEFENQLTNLILCLYQERSDGKFFITWLIIVCKYFYARNDSKCF